MKKILAVTLALAATSSVFAQSYDSDSSYAQRQDDMGSSSVPTAMKGSRHMLEFGPKTLEALVLSFDKIKVNGADSDNDTNLDLSVNYAYGVAQFLQAGFRTSYFSGVKASKDVESMTLEVGGILNSNEDFSRAAYLSLFVGGGWIQSFAGAGSTRDDLRLATLAVGKRIPLDNWGIKHVTYSPEIALQMINSTTDESLDYAQSLQLRLVQFSVLF